MKRKTRLAALVLVAALCAGFITGCGAPAKPTYTVTFDLNGGELVSGELTQTVTEGENAVCPEAVNGRLALAWDKSAENITADTVITAQWSKVVMDTADLAEYVQDRTVTVNVKTITGGSGTGSGFFVDSEGTIVTNFHVIDMAEEISVEVNSGAVYVLDDLSYALLSAAGDNPDEMPCLPDADPDAAKAAWAELMELRQQGLLYAPMDYVDPETAVPKDAPVKALCLHVSHDCNLRCKYCFASTGDFGTGRKIMPPETALKAIDWVVKKSGKRHNI